MHIAFVASEMAPFAKSGGLADVVGALPAAMTRMGHQATCVLPLYGAIDRKKWKLAATQKTVDVSVGKKTVPAKVFWASHVGVDVFFIEHGAYWDRAGLYGDGSADYVDNAERFAFFCRAALTLLDGLETAPQVIHAHDWQAALIPVYLSEQGADYPRLSSMATGTVFTIHNLAYQGLFDADCKPVLGLPKSMFSMQEMEFHGRVNLMKGGIVRADAITTVSPAYAKEVLTPAFGCGLEGVIGTRKDNFTGILNGIDTAVWNPETDPELVSHFGPDQLAARAPNREALMASLGIWNNGDPIIGLVGRLVDQKGLNLVLAVLDDIIAMGANLAVVGTGDPAIEEALQRAVRSHPARVGVKIGFDDALARIIYAGADLFLMPSGFEPCGLSQLIAMHYGCPPIVHRVGGLADTVEPYKKGTDTATGFGFDRFTADGLLACVKQAVETVRQPKIFDRIQHNAMTHDVSWDASARQYEAVYTRCAPKAQNSSGSAAMGQGMH